MRNKLLFAICFFALILFSQGCTNKKKKDISLSSPITEVSFDSSMGKSEKELQFVFVNNDDVARYTKMKSIYEKNLPSKVAASRNPRIPKIIHQIWIGPKIPPAYFSALADKVKVMHPDWEYHLWDDESLAALNLDNWDLVEQSQNWAEKSDIIRCSLLERFGGVYMDEDFEVFSALDELHEKYDFYAGLEFPHKIATTNNRVWVGISIMACRPNHPIMKNWKRRIRNGWDQTDLLFSSQIEKVINHTYFPFTHAVMQEIDKPGNIDIVFPATYFYPLTASNASKRTSSVRAWREKLYDFLEKINLRKPRPFSKIYPESIGVHYWGNTWLPAGDVQVKDLYCALDKAKMDLYNMQKKVRSMEKRLNESEEQVSSILSSLTKKGEEENTTTQAEAALEVTQSAI